MIYKNVSQRTSVCVFRAETLAMGFAQKELSSLHSVPIPVCDKIQIGYWRKQYGVAIEAEWQLVLIKASGGRTRAENTHEDACKFE